MATLPTPDSFDSSGNRPVPRHGIRIALHLSLLSACAYWIIAFMSDRQWHEQHPGAGAGGVPDRPSTTILRIAVPFVPYLLSVSLLSTRSEELIAAGAGIAAGISPFSLMFSVLAFLGATFFSFSTAPYYGPMALSLLVLFAGSGWMMVSAFRIGKVNWGAFLLAAGVTSIGLAICVHKA